MSNNETKRSLDNIQSFPVLTSETRRRVARRLGGSDAPLAQTVEQALYETLGWRPRLTDPEGFVAALTQSFTAEEVEGRTKWRWKPTVYTIQADLGEVTGAQASIYKRAKVILDESLPLLEGLKPLRPDFDEEDTEASRAIVESNLTELVDELGRVGGPRVQRINTIFDVLLDVGPDERAPEDSEQVGGQLGVLRERFGFERGRANRVQEEHIATNYRILVDYVLTLKRSWDADRAFFARPSSDVFLGTHLVWISRALASLVESVHEARDAMDSVYFGEEQRQTLYLNLDYIDTQLTMSELLDWAERFGTEEGPRLIREGGRDGVRSFLPTLEILGDLLDRAVQLSESGSNPTPGFHTPRVARTLRELHQASQFILERAKEVAGPAEPAPEVKAVQPAYGFRGDEALSITIIGLDFQGGVEVRFSPGDVNVVESELQPNGDLELVIAIDDAPEVVGLKSITVTNPDEQSHTLPNAFLVLDRPPDLEDGPPPDDIPPTVTIKSPEAGQDFGEQERIDFSGTAFDSKGVDLTAGLQWDSDKDGAIGHGGMFSRSDLSVDDHIITAKVTDSAGLTDYDETELSVSEVEAVIPEGPSVNEVELSRDSRIRLRMTISGDNLDHVAAVGVAPDYFEEALSAVTPGVFPFELWNDGIFKRHVLPGAFRREDGELVAVFDWPRLLAVLELPESATVISRWPSRSLLVIDEYGQYDSARPAGPEAVGDAALVLREVVVFDPTGRLIAKIPIETAKTAGVQIQPTHRIGLRSAREMDVDSVQAAVQVTDPATNTPVQGVARRGKYARDAVFEPAGRTWETGVYELTVLGSPEDQALKSVEGVPLQESTVVQITVKAGENDAAA